MSRMTIIIGILLILLGLAAYFLIGRTSATALIPTWFGLAYVLLGYLALRLPNARRHLMHVAAVISLVGIIGNLGAVSSMPQLLAGYEVPRPAAVVSRTAMALLCAVHLVAAVRSFILARVLTKFA